MTADKVELNGVQRTQKGNTMKNSKLTAAATFDGLCTRFEVYATGVDKLAAAIEDGTVDNILRECADVMYGGDMKPVRAQFGRVIASQKCNADKRGINTLIDRRRKDAIMLLEAYHKKAINTGDVRTRSGFKYTKEEVDALVAADNVEELQHFYNNIHSLVDKSISGLAMSQLTDKQKDRIAVKEYVSEQLSKVKARRKANGLNQTGVSERLLNKLNSGKATSLSKADVAELLKILGK